MIWSNVYSFSKKTVLTLFYFLSQKYVPAL